MNLKKFGCVAALAAAVVAVAQTSEGGPLGYMQLTLSPSGNAGPLRDSSGLSVSVAGETAAVWQGGGFVWYNVTYTPAAGTSPLQFYDPAPVAGLSGQQIVTFCIDFTEDINWNTQYGSPNTSSAISVIPLALAPTESNGNPGTLNNNPGPSNGMGPQAAIFIEELWKKYFDGTIVSELKSNSPNLQTDVAAFQLAIWKIEYDVGSFTYTGGVLNSPDFTAGNLTNPHVTVNDVTNPIVTEAKAWLQSLVNNPSWSERANLVAISGVGFQDQVTEIAAPEPASALVWLSTASIAGVVALRRRNFALAA